MKDFFTQCMKDLHTLTGIEQVRWMQNDLVNGKRDFDLCVSAMVETAKEFPYIPQEDQQAIIRRMMIQDRNYKHLDSRAVWGWLDAHKGPYFRGQTHFEESVNHKPAPPEVADKWLQKWQEELAKIGDPQYMTSGIKDQRIQALKGQLEGIECTHTSPKGESEYFEFEPGILTCMTCGHKKNKEFPVAPC